MKDRIQQKMERPHKISLKIDFSLNFCYTIYSKKKGEK